MRLTLHASPLIAAAFLALGTASCVAEPMDDDVEETAELSEELAAPVFIRSDQLSFGRAPSNTGDRSKGVNQEFTSPKQDADQVIEWLKDHPGYDNPLYLGCIHAWIYDTSHTYRSNIHTLASRIRQATNHPIMFYFEEENASHSRHPVSKSHGQALRTLAKSAKLIMATYTDGKNTKAGVTSIVNRWKSYYHGELGIPMKAMLIDVDLSQTPSNFYYGSRGNLGNFNKVVRWTLDAAYAKGFGGFHTYGNVGGTFGTKRAADSTYDALNDAWDALVEKHPNQKFTGL